MKYHLFTPTPGHHTSHHNSIIHSQMSPQETTIDPRDHNTLSFKTNSKNTRCFSANCNVALQDIAHEYVYCFQDLCFPLRTVVSRSLVQWELNMIHSLLHVSYLTLKLVGCTNLGLPHKSYQKRIFVQLKGTSSVYH